MTIQEQIEEIELKIRALWLIQDELMRRQMIENYKLVAVASK